MAAVDREDVLRVLERSPLFEGLDSRILCEMTGALRPERWPRHRPVMSPAETAERFYVLVEGRVKVFRQNSTNAREVTLFLLGPGDGFNVISLLDRQRHEAAAVTLDAVGALSGPVDLWQRWLDTHPAFRRAVRRYIHLQIRRLADLVDDLALHDTMSRLAHLILRYFDGVDGEIGPRPDLIKDLPHEELAHMIGTVRVVVNRLLAQLKREGIVDIHGGELHLLNLQKLLLKAEHHVHHTPRG